MHQDSARRSLENPLLLSSEEGLQSAEKHGCDHGECKIIAEVKKQLCLAGPLVVVSFLQYSLQLVSIMFAGHLGELSLSSASMATSFAAVTGFSFVFGMGTALETFCGQSFGAKQYHMLGIHTQRAMLVLTIIGLPIALTWCYTSQIFAFFDQDPQISRMAGLYARWLIPSIFPYGLLQCQMRFLQAQNIVMPLTISSGITSLVHVGFCWLLITRLGLGNPGAALSSAISYWINVLILAVYIKYSAACQKTWTGFSREGTKDLLEFLRFGVPSALMSCLEWWSYEFLVLMSGLLPNPKLETSVMSISLNTSTGVFRIPSGFGSAVSTRVSNELGAGNPEAARLAVRVVICIAIIESLCLAIVAMLVRNTWGYLYTNEAEVVLTLAYIMPVLALSNFVDGIQGVLSGAVRGCGWQKMGAAVNLGAYYLVGLPSAMILTFIFHYRAKGLWMGIVGGSATQSLLLLVITLRTDWKQEAKRARDRVFGFSIVPAGDLVK